MCKLVDCILLLLLGVGGTQLAPWVLLLLELLGFMD
jgi:hypothetical protein